MKAGPSLIVLILALACATAQAQDRFNFAYSGSGISAAGAFQAAILGPPHSEQQLLSAMADERRGAMDRAEAEYAEAARSSRGDAGIALSYAQFLERRGKGDVAWTFLTELRKQRPENPAVLAAVAELALARHDWAAAQDAAKALRKSGDRQGGADQIEGAALIGQGKVDDAIALFQNAAKAAPSAAQPMALLVGALLRAGKTDRALIVLQSALQANPNDAATYVLKGSIEGASGNEQEARQSFRLAIEKQPDTAAAYVALAQLDAGQKRYDDALATARAGLTRQPGNMPLQLAAAGALERAGRYDDAIREYEHMLSAHPGSLIAANNLASLLSDRRDDGASLERAQRLAAVLRNSQVPQFMDTLGWVAYRNGNYDAAIPLLTKAAAALPGHVMVRYHLGMALLAAGQRAQAEEQLKAALALKPDPASQKHIRGALTKLADQR